MEKPMGRSLYITKDQSPTIYWPTYDEHYHSVHGALTESKHVFIQAGLKEVDLQRFSIFEMGFGTGLNALLTAQYAQEHKLTIKYVTIDAFPLTSIEASQLGKCNHYPFNHPYFQLFHEIEWNKEYRVNDYFTLLKKNVQLQQVYYQDSFHLLYYDAFAPSAQPELWTKENFLKLYQMLRKNGILTTYCAKGQVKRDLIAVGFSIESLPGPPGKREMIRARKLNR